jgi:hypothetical protein
MALKKDLEHLVRHVIGDLVVVGVIAAIGFVGIYWGFSELGLFSYNALPKREVDKVYAEFIRRYNVLSKVKGMLGPYYYERGIVTNRSDGGIPLYFHYLTDGMYAYFQFYIVPFEAWTTSPGIGGIGKLLTQQAVYP